MSRYAYLDLVAAHHLQLGAHVIMDPYWHFYHLCKGNQRSEVWSQCKDVIKMDLDNTRQRYAKANLKRLSAALDLELGGLVEDFLKHY